MADRWMDERDRDWRDRDWRRSEGYGRGDEDRPRSGETRRWDEDRSWAAPADDDRGRYERADRDRRSFGESDEDYGGRSGLSSGGGYGGESYGRGLGGRSQAYQSGPSQGRYSGGSWGFTNQDYTGRSYADEAGRGDYGYRSRSASYDQGRRETRRAGRSRDWEAGGLGLGGYGSGREPSSGWEDEGDRAYGRERGFAGNEGRGWREAERGERRGGRWEDERREQGRGEGAGDFFQRAGERISSWFRGDTLMRHDGDEERGGEPRRYSADYGREARWEDPGRGHRGRGPKGYKRSDERISDEVHDRLTDDPWLDASDIQIEVKNGEVTLSGHVDNREAKHRAERLVEDLSGVDHVQNNLRVDPSAGLTGAGRGYGSSALEAEMRRNAQAANPGNEGASGISGRTSTGAAAERSTATATETSIDPKTGVKRS